MSENGAQIDCLTFRKQESVIEEGTVQLNTADNASQKANCAEDLQQQVDVLLSCPDYDEQSADCRNCHLIASMRKKVAGLILKAKKLAE